eukprot:gene12902-12720_t
MLSKPSSPHAPVAQPPPMYRSQSIRCSPLKPSLHSSALSTCDSAKAFSCSTTSSSDALYIAPTLSETLPALGQFPPASQTSCMATYPMEGSPPVAKPNARRCLPYHKLPDFMDSGPGADMKGSLGSYTTARRRSSWLKYEPLNLALSARESQAGDPLTVAPRAGFLGESSVVYLYENRIRTLFQASIRSSPAMKNCGSALMHAISGDNATGIPSVTSGDQRMVYSPYDYEVKKVTKKRYIKLGSQLYSQVVKGVAPADSNVSGGRNYLDDFDPLLMIVGHHALLTGLALPPDVPHLFRLTCITKTSNQLLNTHFLDDNVSSDMHLSTVLNNLCPADWFVPGSKISSSYCTMKDGVYNATIPIDPSQIPAFLRDGPTCLNSFAVWNKTKTAVVRGAPSIITPTGTSHTHRVRFVALLHRSSMWDGPQEPTNEELLRLALRAIILRIVAPDLLKNGIYTKAFHHGGMPDLEIQSPEGGPRGNAAEKRDREEAALGEGEQPNKLHTAREDPMEVNDQPLPTFGLPSPTPAKTPGGPPPSNTPTANLRDGDGFLKDVAAAQPIHEGYDTQYPAHIMAFAEYCQYAEEMMNNP